MHWLWFNSSRKEDDALSSFEFLCFFIAVLGAAQKPFFASIQNQPLCHLTAIESLPQSRVKSSYSHTRRGIRDKRVVACCHSSHGVAEEVAKKVSAERVFPVQSDQLRGQ